MNKVVYETDSPFYPNIIFTWLIRIIIMVVIIYYSIFEIPLYFGITYIVIAFYLIFVKYFQFKLYRFFNKIEFDDIRQMITFYYRDYLFKKGKYLLPYSKVYLWKRKTIISTSTFIKDKRKKRPFNFVGAITKENVFGKKYWNEELYNLVVTKLNSIEKKVRDTTK